MRESPVQTEKQCRQAAVIFTIHHRGNFEQRDLAAQPGVKVVVLTRAGSAPKSFPCNVTVRIVDYADEKKLVDDRCSFLQHVVDARPFCEY